MLSKLFKLIWQVYAKPSQNPALNSSEYISGATILKSPEVFQLLCCMKGGRKGCK